MRTSIRWIKLALIAGAIGGVYADLGTAHAQASVYAPPWSNTAVTALIARVSPNNDQVIIWDRKDTPAEECFMTIIGNSTGLFGNTRIQGSQKGDNMAIQPTPTIRCGRNLNAPIYNGFFLDLDGQGGGDFLNNPGTGNTYLFGGSGNDLMENDAPNRRMQGGTGNDVLLAWGLDATGEGVYGQDGNDCLEDWNASAFEFDCGANDFPIFFDRANVDHMPPNAESCEFTTRYCVDFWKP